MLRRTPVVAAAAVLALTGCDVSYAQPVGPPTAAPTRGGPTGSAQAQLGRLAVAQPHAMRGYSRDRFKTWRSAGANCDVRDEVLRRDGTRIKLDGCNVVGGRWTAVYDGTVVTDPSQVDIDHLVPLANAWRSGADTWTDARREDFANDVDDPQLVVATQASNRSKGDQDPSQWKPPRRAAWCTYARAWIAVKAHWKLTVTSAEKSALADMLETC